MVFVYLLYTTLAAAATMSFLQGFPLQVVSSVKRVTSRHVNFQQKLVNPRVQAQSFFPKCFNAPSAATLSMTPFTNMSISLSMV